MQNYIDLSKLEKPEIIESLNVEAIFKEALKGFQEYLNAVEGAQATNGAGVAQNNQIFNALLASDPAVKLMEYWAYREFLLRARINDAFAQTLLAYARGEALDHKAAPWNITRGVIGYDEKGEPIKWQSDDDLRKIIQMAPEGISTAGSRMSYVFHGLNLGRLTKALEVEKPDENTIIITHHLNPQDETHLQAIRDVNAVCPKVSELTASEKELFTNMGFKETDYAAGHVHIAALSYADDGKVSAESLKALEKHLSKEFIRPLTDKVTVMQGINKEYNIKAEIELMAGVDPQMVKDEAEANLNAFVIERYKLGEIASIAGIYDAIHTPNVRRVKLIEPTADIITKWNEAPKCTSVELLEVSNG